MKQIFRAGVLYFALVFAVGFVLGTIRTLWVVPRLGSRTAELIEAPIMLGVSIFSARYLIRRLLFPATWLRRLASGAVALALMLVAEFGFVLWVRGLTIQQYLLTRDPISGTVYFMTLGVFAVIPVFIGSPRTRPTSLVCRS